MCLGVALFSLVCLHLVSAFNVKTRFSSVGESLFYFSGDSSSPALFHFLCSLFPELLLFGYLISWIYLLIKKTMFFPMLSLFRVFLFVCVLVVCLFVCFCVCFLRDFLSFVHLSRSGIWVRRVRLKPCMQNLNRHQKFQ